jgi:hypothetical protein
VVLEVFPTSFKCDLGPYGPMIDFDIVLPRFSVPPRNQFIPWPHFQSHQIFRRRLSSHRPHHTEPTRAQSQDALPLANRTLDTVPLLLLPLRCDNGTIAPQNGLATFGQLLGMLWGFCCRSLARLFRRSLFQRRDRFRSSFPSQVFSKSSQPRKVQAQRLS